VLKHFARHEQNKTNTASYSGWENRRYNPNATRGAFSVVEVVVATAKPRLAEKGSKSNDHLETFFRVRLRIATKSGALGIARNAFVPSFEQPVGSVVEGPRGK